VEIVKLIFVAADSIHIGHDPAAGIEAVAL
jgi:hypothetical protein